VFIYESSGHLTFNHGSPCQLNSKDCDTSSVKNAAKNCSSVHL